MTFSFDGRLAMVTGASGGIGARMLPGDDEPGHLPMPIPVGHLGRPEDIADMALAMLASQYLTSKVVAVGGGIYPA